MLLCNVDAIVLIFYLGAGVYILTHYYIILMAIVLIFYLGGGGCSY